MMQQKTVNALSAMAILSSPLRQAYAARALTKNLCEAIERRVPDQPVWVRQQQQRVYN